MGRTDPVIHHGDLKEHDALNNVKVHQTLISDFLSSEPPSMHIVLKILMVGHFTYNFGIVMKILTTRSKMTRRSKLSCSLRPHTVARGG